QPQIQNEQLKSEAFSFLDKAKKLELEGNFEDAIIRYMAAIKLLVKLGWTESQLDNIKKRILNLTQNIEEQKIKSHVVETSSLPIPDFKAESLKGYQREKIDRDALQNRAFALMDQAKKFEKDKSFDKAIINYQEALESLNSLGWEEQTKNILNEIERLILLIFYFLFNVII
ncbi:unnamed protein product, partial [marine sediment metagenome]